MRFNLFENAIQSITNNCLIVSGSSTQIKSSNYTDYIEWFKFFNIEKIKEFILSNKKLKKDFTTYLQKNYEGFDNIEKIKLDNPVVVGALHFFIKDNKIDIKRKELFFSFLKDQNPKPQIFFDTILKNKKEENILINKLINSGYESTNINVLYVLTEYEAHAKKHLTKLVNDKIEDKFFDQININKIFKDKIKGDIYLLLDPEKTNQLYPIRINQQYKLSNLKLILKWIDTKAYLTDTEIDNLIKEIK